MFKKRVQRVPDSDSAVIKKFLTRGSFKPVKGANLIYRSKAVALNAENNILRQPVLKRFLLQNGEFVLGRPLSLKNSHCARKTSAIVPNCDSNVKIPNSLRKGGMLPTFTKNTLHENLALTNFDSHQKCIEIGTLSLTHEIKSVGALLTLALTQLQVDSRQSYLAFDASQG